METIKIGFIGGCINNQKGIGPDEFYYAVVSAHLSNTNHQINAAIYYTFDKMAEKVKTFTNKNQPETIYLWIRQFPLMPLHKPLIKYENRKGGISWALHPSLISRKPEWDRKLTEHHTQNEYVYKKRLKFGPRDLNLLAGAVLGLHKWAQGYVIRELDKVVAFCKEKGIKLVVISPQQCPSSVMGNAVCKWISVRIEKHCREQNISFINIIRFGKGYYGEDNVHFNAACHKILGGLIYGSLKEHFSEIERNADILGEPVSDSQVG